MESGYLGLEMVVRADLRKMNDKEKCYSDLSMAISRDGVGSGLID
jgi:hypothetical protein